MPNGRFNFQCSQFCNYNKRRGGARRGGGSVDSTDQRAIFFFLWSTTKQTFLGGTVSALLIKTFVPVCLPPLLLQCGHLARTHYFIDKYKHTDRHIHTLLCPQLISVYFVSLCR